VRPYHPRWGGHTFPYALAVTSSVLGAPASLIGSELSSLLGSDLSICLALMPQGYPCTELHRMGERQTYAPPSPPWGYQSTDPP
jgi:hypothetical protein